MNMWCSWKGDKMSIGSTTCTILHYNRASALLRSVTIEIYRSVTKIFVQFCQRVYKISELATKAPSHTPIYTSVYSAGIMTGCYVMLLGVTYIFTWLHYLTSCNGDCTWCIDYRNVSTYWYSTWTSEKKFNAVLKRAFVWGDRDVFKPRNGAICENYFQNVVQPYF